MTSTLSEQDARALVNQYHALVTDADRTVKDTIRQAFADARPIVAAFINGHGWKALGYATFKDCAAVEFDYSTAHLYRLAKAAEIQAELIEQAQMGAALAALFMALDTSEPDLSPIGDKIEIPSIPTDTGVLMPLAKLPAGERGGALVIATQLARAQGKAEPTAPMMAAAVKAVRKRIDEDADRRAVHDAPYAFVEQWMIAGRLTPAAARVLADTLQRVKPEVRGLVATFGVLLPALVLEINRVYEKSKDDPDGTWQDFSRHGVIVYGEPGFDSVVSINKATMPQWNSYLEWRKDQRMKIKALERMAMSGQAEWDAKLIRAEFGGVTFTIPDSAAMRIAQAPRGARFVLHVAWEAETAEVKEAA